MSLRKFFFWFHLIIGLVGGLFITSMLVTGTLITFNHDLIDWADRAVAHVTVPADAKPLSMAEINGKLRAYNAELKPSGFVVRNDPTAAIVVQVGRDENLYVNPYTGDIAKPNSGGVRAFMRAIEDFHRWIGLANVSKDVGKNITGAASLIFFGLGLTGLIIWWPRNYTWQAIKPTVFFRRGAKGKARDWNWHNVLGIWFLLVLLVESGTGVIMAYRWANNLLFASVGETVPERGEGGPGGQPGASVEIKKPSEDARPLSQDALLAQIQKQYPNWESLSVRSANGNGMRRPDGDRPRGEKGERGERGEGERRRPADTAQAEGGQRRQASAVTIALIEKDQFPKFASTMLTVNPYTAEVLKVEGFSTASTGKKLRSWARFLHTGEAFGFTGKLIAALAGIAGIVLVYTGYALSWRRFFKRKAVAQA